MDSAAAHRCGDDGLQVDGNFRFAEDYGEPRIYLVDWRPARYRERSPPFTTRRAAATAPDR